MTATDVYFVFDEQRVPSTYSVQGIAIGQIVHVAQGAGFKFSPSPSPGSVPHCITWIAPSDWTIFLESRLTVAEHDVARVTQALGDMFSRAEVRRALYHAAAQVSVRKLHLGETWPNSIPGKCLAVAERLHLVEQLRHESVESKLAWHSVPLVEYLLLTCFDVLGQSTGWSPFGNWISSRRSGPDLSRVPQTAAGPVEIAAALHDQWLEKYGTRNSFYRFINETINADQRAALLQSIEIIKYPLPPKPGALTRGARIPETDEEKLKFLYKVRNSFTHEARAVPGQSASAPKEPVRSRGQAIEGEVLKNFITKDWPNALVVCAKAGLSSVLEEQLSTAPPDLIVPERLPSGPGHRSNA